MSCRFIRDMVCASEGDDPKDSHHKPLRTMTFTLRINNIQTSSNKLNLVQAKDLKLSMKADPLTAHKDNGSPDEFFIKDDEGDSSGFGTRSSSTFTETFGGGDGNNNEGSSNGFAGLTFSTFTFNERYGSKNNDWKLEAVKGYLQNEQEHMSGWWKNLSTNRASDFTTAHLDFI